MCAWRESMNDDNSNTDGDYDDNENDVVVLHAKIAPL